jgi:orotidine-5'-phosphate decarboxylase
LILALDATNDVDNPDRMIEADDARRMVGELDDLVSFVKVGWALYMGGGNQVVREFVERGKQVFLDLKFGDIDETVKRLVLVAVDQGVSFITLNAGFSAVRAAVKARGNTQLKILLVTMLTSWSEADLAEMGFTLSASEYVAFRAKGAIEAGCDGVIASGREVAEIRRIAPPGFLVVTPGIRPGGAGHDDHKRAVTPGASILAGSDYLVVGRPITTAANPRQATTAILEEMQQAFDARTLSSR